MSRHTLIPMRDYKAVQAASLRRYRERIADFFAFQTTRAALLERGSVVDAVARAELARGKA